MKVNRREFLKLTASTAGALLLPSDLVLAGEQEGTYFPLHKMVGRDYALFSWLRDH